MSVETKALSIIDPGQLTPKNITETGDFILGEKGQLSRIPGVEGVEYDILLGDIVPNPEQPRESFDEEEMERLRSSMQEAGQRMSITVVPFHEIETGSIKFFIADGGCRYLTAKTLGWESLRAVAKWIPTTRGIREEALINTIVRSGYNPIDTAKALQKLAEEIQDGEFVSLAEAVEKVCLRTGLSIGSINRSRSLLNLDPEIQEMLRRKQISPEAAFDLAKTKKRAGDDLDLAAVGSAVTQISDDGEKRPKTPIRRLLDNVVDTQLRRSSARKADEINAGRVVRRLRSALREAVNSVEEALSIKERDMRIALQDPSGIVRNIKESISLLLEFGNALGISSSDLGVNGQFSSSAGKSAQSGFSRDPFEEIVFRESPTRRKVDGLLNWNGSATAKRLLKILAHRANLVGSPLALKGLATAMNLSTDEVFAAASEIRDVLVSVDLALVQTGSQENPEYEIGNSNA